MGKEGLQHILKMERGGLWHNRWRGEDCGITDGKGRQSHKSWKGENCGIKYGKGTHCGIHDQCKSGALSYKSWEGES